MNIGNAAANWLGRLRDTLRDSLWQAFASRGLYAIAEHVVLVGHKMKTTHMKRSKYFCLMENLDAAVVSEIVPISYITDGVNLYDNITENSRRSWYDDVNNDYYWPRVE